MNKRKFGVIVAAIFASLIPTQSPVDAQLTGCSKWTEGVFGYSWCGSSDSNPPYTTMHVVNVLCVRPWYLGGGSQEMVGNWARKGVTSYVRCPNSYNATNPRILFK